MDKQLEEVIILVRAGTITKFKAIEDIKTLFRETIEQAMPEKQDADSLIGNSHATLEFYRRLGFNAALEDVKSNLLKAIGKENING